MNLICGVVACLLTVALAACGGEQSSTAADGGGPRVVASTGIAADVVRSVAGGRAEVTQLVPGSADPHDYAPSAKDRARLAEADLVVGFGRGLEQGLQLDDVEAPQLALADALGPGRDPHIWMDPTLIATAAPALAAALGRVDPGHARAYRARARAYAGRLRRLDRELARELSILPEDRRELVTSHRSLAPFAARYGLRLVATPFGLQPEAEASAADVARVVERVREERVPAVFAQVDDDPELMREVAREAGVPLVDDLRVESLGAGARDLEALLRANARSVREALAP